MGVITVQVDNPMIPVRDFRRVDRYAHDFTDLEVYAKAQEVAARVFQLSSRFPKEEAYSLTDQVRRSSRSVGAQIAEAWGARRYPRYFIRKLVEADAEQLETQHWLRTAVSCGYLQEEDRDEVLDELAQVGRMLQAMISKAHTFCGTEEK